MYANLVLYTEPRRPLINPALDLFAWLDLRQEDNLLLPGKVIDKVTLMLPERCKFEDNISDDLWNFINWQAEEKGYAVVRSIDNNWIYWSMIAEKYTLLNMVRFLF
jgi:hypothetical protein